MDTRPPKRQRRFTVYSSDTDDEFESQIDIEDAGPPSHVPATTKSARDDVTEPQDGHAGSNPRKLPLLSSRPKTASGPGLPLTEARSPSASPEKKKPGKPSNDRQNRGGKSLHSFFQPASNEQRWSSQKFEPTRPAEIATEKAGDDDDLIEDDDSFDELFTRHFLDGNNGVQSSARAQENQKDKDRRAPSTRSNPTRKSTRRFLLPNSLDSGVVSQSSPGAVAAEEDGRPWAQKYSPANLDELAVHKRKVSDVQNWLQSVFSGRSGRRLLVLRGPAGSGKTTTMSLLSNALGFDILEWKNPSTFDSSRGSASIGAQFDEFLGRGDNFGGLDLDGDDDPAKESHGSSSQRRVLLIEEFPTVLSRNSSGLSAFRFSLQRYLAVTALSSSGNSGEMTNPPIVLIVSETLLGSESSVLDNLTAHRLLGADIYNHPNTTIIDFNNIAPTFMQKALRLVLEKDARQSKQSQVPGPAFLGRISELGDVRSAISSLEFLCLKGDKAGAGVWGGSLNKRTKRSSRNDVLTPMEQESLKMVTQREASLGIFHAVGKIVYNKREDWTLTTDGQKPPAPPDHLRQHDRPKVSQVCVDELIDETGTDIQTFISALHENYVLSCGGQSFTDCLNDCIDALSDSDMLCIDRKGSQRNGTRAGLGVNYFSAGVDMLRQDEISYQVATRGLLFALPHPVERNLRSNNCGKDAYKMSFPTSLQLWAASEEIEGLTGLWMKRLLNPFDVPVSHPNSERGWGSQQAGYDTSENDTNGQTKTVTMISRDDALLYQLPYMARISQEEVESRELGKITGFTRIGSQDGSLNGTPLESDVNGQDASLSFRQKQHVKQKDNTFGPRLPPSIDDREEKLVLSDDDILDD